MTRNISINISGQTSYFNAHDNLFTAFLRTVNCERIGNNDFYGYGHVYYGISIIYTTYCDLPSVYKEHSPIVGFLEKTYDK